VDEQDTRGYGNSLQINLSDETFIARKEPAIPEGFFGSQKRHPQYLHPGTVSPLPN
jgi:hypothetical protein